MITTRMMRGAETTDAELVGECLVGDRDAFGRIVGRYQSLVCSLAYSATGCLGQSEDLAQETFIAAWKHLRQLREPAKLRSWLCGIARNRINNFLRREGRKPLATAEPLEAIHEVPAHEPSAFEQAVSQEEEAILWRSLEHIPETYREPLVLFYREHQSVERVAEQLELSEDAVKQRLSRGRKLLHEQVLAFVEGALERTAPGKAFTVGVLAALPVFATTASAATLGATAAKGSAMAKAAAVSGLAGAILGPIIGILGGVLGVKASLANAQSPRERRMIVRFTWITVGMVAVSLGVMAGFVFLLRHDYWKAHPVFLTVSIAGFWVAYMVVLLTLILVFNRKQRRVRAEEAAKLPPDAVQRSQPAPFAPVEYRSKRTLLGIPLFHMRLGLTAGCSMRPVVGWIAVGDFAVGVLFAFGGVAFGAISFGGLSVGLLSFGGAGLGICSLAGLAVGYWALGGLAVGWFALGGVALGWQAALGGAAVAHELAVGGVAHAAHANDALARAFVDGSAFFRLARSFMGSTWFWLSCWLPMLLVMGQAIRLQRRRERAQREHGNRLGHAGLWAVLLLFAMLGEGCKQSAATSSAVSAMTLSNGIRVVSVSFSASTNVSIFAFLPLGLATDGPGQAQWSHLIEHLVIRSTVPADSAQANAETLPDHMRLDSYGHTGNYQEGLSHHRRWLEGTPFTEASLAAEKPKVIAEGDFTARNLATHKFAVAAWSQGFRHGRTNIALKGDVTRARLADVQRLRDERLAVSNRVTVCVVGGLAPEQVFAEAEKQLGGVRLRGKPLLSSKEPPRKLDLTWDLDARHLLLVWPIPDFQEPDHAALMVAAQCLNMQLASDPQVTRQAGMTFAGADLATPEGSYFFVSASLRPQASLKTLRDALHAHLARLASDSRVVAQASQIGRQLSLSMTTVPDARSLRAQTPPGMTPAMIEGNAGLQLGMQAHRYGEHRAGLARQLAEVTPGSMQKAAKERLSADKCLECVLRKTGDPNPEN